MSFKLYAFRVFSHRWDESLAFYRDTVGFPLHFASAEQGWAQFQLGEAFLGLERLSPDDPESEALVGRFVGTSIMVEDMQQTYERVTAAGVKFTGPPETQPWGGALAHFKDPDGNVLTLLGNPN